MTQEALKLALEWFEKDGEPDHHPVVTAIKEALADHAMRETQRLGQEIEQELVAITNEMAFAFHSALTDGAIGEGEVEEIKAGLAAAFAHITTPPQRTEQEPVAHWSDCSVHSEPAYPKGECDCGGIVAVADYTALSDKYVALSDKYVALKAQRKPLTDEQIDAACKAGKIYRIDFIRAYQAAHDIKENT